MKTKLLMLVYWLLILGVFTRGITSVVGLIIAYVFMGDASSTEKTHYSYQINSFWLFLLYGIILTLVVIILALSIIGLSEIATIIEGARSGEFSGPLSRGEGWGPFGCCRGWGRLGANSPYFGYLIGIFLPYILLPIFAIARFIKGFRLLLKKQPIPNPKTWLI